MQETKRIDKRFCPKCEKGKDDIIVFKDGKWSCMNCGHILSKKR